MRKLCELSFLFIMGFSTELYAQPLSNEAMVNILKEIDSRMKSPGDYQALTVMEYQEPGKESLVQQLAIYRRDADESLIILFTAPSNVAGQGYLRIEQNMWFYDPSGGRWTRMSESARIGSSSARRRDFDYWDLAGEYDPAYVGEEMLGAIKAIKLKLSAKPDKQVGFAAYNLWIDANTHSPLKMEALTPGGKLAQTYYYPKWAKVVSPTKNKEVYYPLQIMILDEIIKGAKTIINIQKADLAGLEKNIFTKAWLESKIR